eukprot:3415662-Amphidinium_carterae.1
MGYRVYTYESDFPLTISPHGKASDASQKAQSYLDPTYNPYWSGVLLDVTPRVKAVIRGPGILQHREDGVVMRTGHRTKKGGLCYKCFGLQRRVPPRKGRPQVITEPCCFTAANAAP